MGSIKNKCSKSPCMQPPMLIGALSGTQTISPVKLKTLKSRAQALMLELENLLAQQPSHTGGPIDFYEEVKRFEINLILWALEQTGGEQTNAARLLRLKKTTLNAMIARYGLNKGIEEISAKDLMTSIDYNSRAAQ